MFSWKFCLGVFFVFIAYFYSGWRGSIQTAQDLQEQSIIDAWNSSIISPTRQFQRIACGINCNLDLIVSGVELIKGLGHGPGISRDNPSLASVEDLTNTFTHFFTKGSAAERSFVDKDVFRNVLDVAERLESKEHYIGGNAALMAVQIAQQFPNAKIQLVGPIGPVLLDLLDSRLSVPEDTVIQTDETHLIMEYGLNEEWDNLISPVANRFITSYDESNSKVTLLDNYFIDTARFDPDLVLLSGLHMLETQEVGYIREKLEETRVGLSKIDISVPVHLELASMANNDCVKLILEKVIPSVTSLGLNEQELTFASHVANGPHSDYYLIRSGQPEIHLISDMIYWLLETYGYSKNNPESQLTRVHFHSLTYHIVGTVAGAWRNSKSAVAAGTRLAGRQACDTAQLSPQDIELRIPQTFKLYSGDKDRHFNESAPVSSWMRSGIEFVFSPVLVCKSPLKTVGLGDAISSTGLMFSEFNANYKEN